MKHLIIFLLLLTIIGCEMHEQHYNSNLYYFEKEIKFETDYNNISVKIAGKNYEDKFIILNIPNKFILLYNWDYFFEFSDGFTTKIIEYNYNNSINQVQINLNEKIIYILK